MTAIGLVIKRTMYDTQQAFLIHRPKRFWKPFRSKFDKYQPMTNIQWLMTNYQSLLYDYERKQKTPNSYFLLYVSYTDSSF